jgi:hypothetical protein
MFVLVPFVVMMETNLLPDDAIELKLPCGPL